MTAERKFPEALKDYDLSEFKTPEELKIRSDEFEYLFKTAMLLCKSGDNYAMPSPKVGEKPLIHVFDMRDWLMDFHGEPVRHHVGETTHTCNSVGCIRGSADLVAGAEGQSISWQHRGYSMALHRLFLPWDGGGVGQGQGHKITPRIAADATMHFLKTGTVKFDIPS